MWVIWNLASFHLETVLASVQDWCTDCAKRTISSENHFGRTQWYFKVTRLKWKLDSVHLGIVLLLMQDRCMVFAECTTGSELVLESPDGLLGDVGHVEPRFSPFRDSVSVGAR